MGEPVQTPTRCRALTVTITDLLITLARESAVKGSVSIETIERIGDLLKRGTITLDESLRAHEESCRHSHNQPASGKIGSRSNPFPRLMVRPFEHLLAGDPPAFPRSHLDNYFGFLAEALGGRMGKFEAQCRTVIQGLLVVHGNNLTWDIFYGNLGTLKILTGALNAVARTLGTAQGQRLWWGWMMMPQGDLPPPDRDGVHEVLEVLLSTHRDLSVAAEWSL